MAESKISNSPPPQQSGNYLTRSKAFQTLVKKTFEQVDTAKNDEVDKNELYAGLLMVHLKLAKFCGPAACYPPSKEACDKLFDAADADQSGGISCEEFSRILGVLCAQIMFRMLVYYLVLILFVPFLSSRVVDFLKIDNGSYLEMAAEQAISMSVFFGAIPTIWNTIDEGAREKVGDMVSTHAAAEVVTEEKLDTDKKDD
jgi:hypothetical protein